MNITLIGMPGSGKSYVGSKLADKLGFTFIEPDKIIEQEYNLPLEQVVERLGRESFLDKEAETTILHTADNKDTVISPGGSIVYRGNAMNHLKKISKLIYLKATLEVLEKRVASMPPRGIVDIEKSLAELYVERMPLYEEWADYTVVADQDVEDVIAQILELDEWVKDFEGEER